MRNLENFNTDVFVSSTVYYEKQDIEKFLHVFSSLDVIDFRLAKYIEILEKLLTSGSFDNLPKSPNARKKKIIGLVKTSIESISDAKARDKITTWFDNACEQEYDIELQEELLYRYCWSEFCDRIQVEDEDSSSFKDKLAIKPIVPDIGRKLIVPMSDIEADITVDESCIFKTGIDRLDDIVKMCKTNFVVVAARASVGKTLFMVNQAIYDAELGNKILYVTLEESQQEVKVRVMKRIGADNKNAKKILDNFIVFTPVTSTPSSVLDEIQRYVKANNISIVFIDYLQLMEYPRMTPTDSLKRLTRELKLFAIKNDILLVTASQLKREVEYTGANLTSLYGSSTIENDANIVIMLEPVRHQNIRINNTTAVSIKIAKNRAAAQGEVNDIMIDYAHGCIIEA